MQLQIRFVGKEKDPRITGLCDDYLTRVGRYLTIDSKPCAGNAALMAKMPAGAFVVAMHPAGKLWDTPQATAFVEKQLLHGRGPVVFLLGGAEGLPGDILSKVDLAWSLTPLTLPHRLARVLLCEQLYRVVSILRGGPYDK